MLTFGHDLITKAALDFYFFSTKFHQPCCRTAYQIRFMRQPHAARSEWAYVQCAVWLILKKKKKEKEKKLKNVQCDLTSTHCVSQHISCGLYQQAAPPPPLVRRGWRGDNYRNSWTTDCGSRRARGVTPAPLPPRRGCWRRGSRVKAFTTAPLCSRVGEP